MSTDNPSANAEIWVIYDGECPLCRAYVLHYRLRQFAKALHLVDARVPHPLVEDLRREGFNLDEGMAVKIDNRIYHGAEAINVLALLGAEQSLFNRLNRFLFRRPRLAELIYPYLVRGRLILLRLLGRSLIGDA